jgi:hypothetical protein
MRSTPHPTEEQVSSTPTISAYVLSNSDAEIVSEYATFISTISKLDILDAHLFKPLIDGTALAKALNTKPGPWMKPALDIIMAWQLRNPSITDPATAIEEVRTSDVVSATPASVKANTNGHVAKKQKKGELTSALVSQFLRETLKPLFSTKAPNPDLTTAGRKRIGQAAKRQDDVDFSNQPPWKLASNAWTLGLLLWCCKCVDGKTLEREWGFIIPPLLAIMDDTETSNRAKGCNMLVAILSTCPPALLKRTGLAPVFEESLYSSVAFLPSLTPEAESVILLNAALPALLELTNVAHPNTQKDDHNSARQKSVDTILRKAILQPYTHAGEHVRIAGVLLKHLPATLTFLGIDSVKHLKDLVPLLSNTLSDPLGPGYPQLLLQASSAMQSVIANAWPRIEYWSADILKGVCVCWIRLEQEGDDIDSSVIESLRDSLKDVVSMLSSILANSGAENTWRADVQRLADADGRLKTLLK